MSIIQTQYTDQFALINRLSLLGLAYGTDYEIVPRISSTNNA